MKAQYRTLGELQRVEEKIQRIETDLSRIPEEVGKLEKLLSTRRDEYQKLKDQTDLAEKNLRKLEGDLKEREDKLNKAESKMMEVKTNEEYQAATRENQTQKDDKKGVEDKILAASTTLDEQKGKLKEAEKEYKSYESSLSGDKTRLEEERLKQVNLMEEQMQHRSAILAQLPPQTAELYVRIASRIKGAAIIQAENGLCTGCNMKIRPQLYNEVLGYKALHRCPSCGRLLIIESNTKEND